MPKKTSPICAEVGCSNPSAVQGLCTKHLDLLAKTNPCASPGCPRPAFCKGLCYGHYRRQLRGGTSDAPLESREGLIRLTGTKVPEIVAKQLRASADAQGISEFEFLRRIILKWYADTTGQIHY